ncbi:M20/M25/M40 family metallo-hydrolase [Arcticibacterium luteifluviistationis]|uniref:Peptidase M28 n=1 Tax=Arcticibacterium luteifluviistationis TaxID=1784714 RepID=A0A2Z4GGF7_9BACT|nr:M20/M25/M40 family metallo-hydrolase [Arcticibacterium luteifluviistationis]AWW00282.1 peptidase M28 [Arcticibacterium luteifluviistationis]
MKTKLILFCLLCLTANAFGQQYQEHVYFLSKDSMKGRGTGSKEANKTAKYIKKAFKEYGLAAKGTRGYYQDFEAKVTRVVVPDSIRKSKNVIGFLDNGAQKTMVIGAHYDHIGEGKQGSLKDSTAYGKIHNGADDNASGVAGLLELARYFSQNETIEPVNFLFISFGAEELGLVGSRYFVNHPTIDLKSVHFMLNMDMIGRFNAERGVSIIGYGTSPEFESMMEQIDREKHVKFYTGYEGRGGSDQTSFYEKDIPVMFFHTGGHPDYHKPTDDPEKVDYESLAGIVELEKAIIEASFSFETLNFRNTDPKEE